MSRQDFASERSRDEGLPAIGDRIDGRYAVRSLIGRGGMGAVYSAEDLERHEQVAIKVMLPDEARSPDAVKRFMREARAARNIASEHVTRVLRVGSLANGLPYMTLELLVGLSLDRVVRQRGPLPVQLAVDYLLQACEGVAAAHARGIIHRDLKPSNLHLSARPDGSQLVKVLDFGVAKATLQLEAGAGAESLSLTETSAMLGSPQYMSPEQLRSSKSVDARADLWSLGLILHKLLSGQTAFQDDTMGGVMAKVLSENPTPIRALRPDVPVGIEQLILCCVEKNPSYRYQDTAQLAEALQPFAAAGAEERVARIRALLDAAGACSTSRPSAPQSASGTWPSVSGDWGTETTATRPFRSTESFRSGRSWNAAAQPRARTSGRWTFVAVAVAAAACAVGVYRFVAPSGPAAARSAAGADPGPAARTAAAGPTAGPTPSSSATPSAVPAGSAVSIRLELEPATAEIELDGKPVPDNPIVLPRSERTQVLVVSARGFRPERRELRAQEDTTIAVQLKPLGAAAAVPVPPKPSSGAVSKRKGPMEETL